MTSIGDGYHMCHGRTTFCPILIVVVDAATTGGNTDGGSDCFFLAYHFQCGGVHS